MLISSQFTTPPAVYQSPLQEAIYSALHRLGIEYKRVECEPAISVEDCEELAKAFEVPVVKTLFVANRQLNRFHFVSMLGEKPFITKDFSRALGVSRVSFVKPGLMMDLIGAPVGAVSPLCVVMDESLGAEVVIDYPVTEYPYLTFPDGTTTNYLRISTRDLLDRFLPACGHTAHVCDI